MTLSGKDEDNYRGNYFIFIMCLAFSPLPPAMPATIIAIALSQKPKVIADDHLGSRASASFNTPLYSSAWIISMHLRRFSLACSGQGGPQISHLD